MVANTMTDTETFMPTFSPRHAENSRVDKPGCPPCFICGKPVEQAVYWSRTHGGSELCTDEYADAHPGGDTGYYPIGRNCYRRLPAEAKRFVTRVHTPAR